MKCTNCNKKTKNDKFCSRSCSASFNNKGIRRHGNAINNCLYCNDPTANSKYKFCSVKCSWDFRHMQAIKNNNLGNHPASIRTILLKFSEHKCVICNTIEWMGKAIPLTVDHINGNPYDNTVANLRLICWNCHAQTPTFGIKNRGNGRKERYRKKLECS